MPEYTFLKILRLDFQGMPSYHAKNVILAGNNRKIRLDL